MLTTDLVDARRRNGELHLRALDDALRSEARGWAADLVEVARAHVGRRREELDEAWAAVAEGAKQRRVALGLRKLVEDACVFEAETAIDPPELRRRLFSKAAQMRREARFVRETAVAETAAEVTLSAEDVERALFSDLRGEHVLKSAPSGAGDTFVDAWELGQAQAVLLAAVRVTCEIETASPGPLRAFFAALKFHRLLFVAEPIESGWRITIDGPFSMFEAVTKYGLRLAMIVPALRELERWSLVADVRWGKLREPLVFRYSSADLPRGHGGTREEPHLSDDVRELMTGLRALDAGWKVKPATKILHVKGHGVCVPDLELVRGKKAPVYVEVLGYWSRDAVFRRVELAEKGLGAKVVFAASSRLRVSQDVMDDALPADLYIYKGKMSPRTLLAHVEIVAARSL